MPELKLTYFDMHGGRGEVARLALSLGGIAFEDERVSFSKFMEIKDAYPFSAVPVMEVDGVVVSQSNSINRYVGKLTDLYPSDPLQALFCDEAMDVVEDAISRFAATLFIEDEAEKKAAREAYASGPLSLYLKRIDALLERRGGSYFAEGRLTVADLKVFVWVRTVRSGIMEYVPTDLPDKLAPRLCAAADALAKDERLVSYYASFG